MKLKIISLFVVLLFISCSKSDENTKSESAEILGKWKLIQVLIDPGDLSGVYENGTDNRIINFLTNGTIASNFSLCSMTYTNGSQVITPYFADENYILPNECFADGFHVSYFLENENLILSAPCIEPCLFKFERTE